MDRTEFKSDATRLFSDVQYLRIMHNSSKVLFRQITFKSNFLQHWSRIMYRVTLKRRSSRMQRRMEIPMTDITSMRTRMSSRIPTDTTKQSKRLKRDMKYDGRPIAYIFMNISTANRDNSTLLVLSANKVKTM